MSAVTWLHLSDWHHGHQDHQDLDREIVLDRLLTDIRERTAIAPKLAQIDFIIFSGDIAWSGKAQEYQAAQENFFEPLLKAAGLEDRGWSRLFVVPGNHDIDRDKLRQVPDDLISPLGERKTVNDCLGIRWKVDALLSPLDEYSRFASQCGAGNETKKVSHIPAYWYVSSVEVEGKKIAIIGLNSTWLSGRTFDSDEKVYDYGRLIAGERQIFSALEELKKLGDVDLRIAVLHHPFTWLTDFDRDLVEERLYRKCDFILHRHEHLPRVNVHRSTLGDVIVIPAGASYNRRLSLDPRYTNAYNFVHLDFQEEQGTTYLRRWSEQSDKWTKDDQLWSEGRFPFSMPKIEARLSPIQREARQRLISRFTPALRKRFCDEVEIVQAHTLENHGDIRLVLVKLHYKITMPPGPHETLGIRLLASPRVAKLIDKGEVSTEPYEWGHFKIDGQPLEVTPTYDKDGNIHYQVELPQDRVSIDFWFTQREMLDGEYTIHVGRFTRCFKLTFVEEPGLEYDYKPLGGFPEIEPADSPVLRQKQMETFELCFPDQGYRIEWHPPID